MGTRKYGFAFIFLTIASPAIAKSDLGVLPSRRPMTDSPAERRPSGGGRATVQMQAVDVNERGPVIPIECVEDLRRFATWLIGDLPAEDHRTLERIAASEWQSSDPRRRELLCSHVVTWMGEPSKTPIFVMDVAQVLTRITYERGRAATFTVDGWLTERLKSGMRLGGPLNEVLTNNDPPPLSRRYTDDYLTLVGWIVGLVHTGGFTRSERNDFSEVLRRQWPKIAARDRARMLEWLENEWETAWKLSHERPAADGRPPSSLTAWRSNQRAELFATLRAPKDPVSKWLARRCSREESVVRSQREPDASTVAKRTGARPDLSYCTRGMSSEMTLSAICTKYWVRGSCDKETGVWHPGFCMPYFPYPGRH